MNGPASTPDAEGSRQALSALMDGDADAELIARACTAWRTHAPARADWHAYHLIGDVLRAPDQGTSARGDAAFLDALRRRLKDEPVIVAPAPVVAEVVRSGADGTVRSARGGWRMPFAAAAGVAAVASVVFIMRPGLTPVDSPLLASTPGLTTPVALGSTSASADGGQIVVVRDPGMLRDARLDRYLDAHRQFAEGGLSLAPAATVRGVSTTAPER